VTAQEGILARLAAALIAAIALQTGGFTAVNTPEVVPAWAETPPQIDGKLDDAVWQKAQVLAGFRAGGAAPKAETTARIAWDGKAFYVAFECEASPSSMKTLYGQDGDPVWQEESVELFIAPWNAPDHSALYHFTVSASGVKTFLRAEEANEKRDWQAAVARSERGWTAEMRIPVELFDQQGENEAAWRILFGRNDKAHDESSSYPESGGRFAWFWNYARLVPIDGKPSFTRFRADLKPLSGAGPTGVTPLKQAPEETRKVPLIIPEPASARFTGSRFPLTPDTAIVIGQSADALDARAAEVLAEWIEKKAGFRPRIERAMTAQDRSRGKIVLGEPWLNPLSAKLLKEQREQVTRTSPGPEGYVIHANAERAVGSGCDQAGTFWAAQTLAQMIQMSEDGKAWIAGGVVRDKPAMPFRSAHLLTAKDALEFQSKLVREILSPFKVNYVILQMDKFAWRSHPEITDPDNNITPEDLRELIAVGRQYHVTYIPLVMSLGHMEWIFRGGHHMDIAEDPNHPYAYCPLNEKSYALMHDLFDEAYELFGRPEYFHIGHDEFDMIGEFPTHEECRKLGKVELYYRDTLRLVEYLRAKGARTMMWGDILTKNGFKEQLARIPKDVIMVDWRYGPMEAYPTVDLYRKAGFEVIGGTWYLPPNIYHFSRYAAERGAMGMMQTTWSGWHTEEVVMKQWPEQMFQYVMGAEWAWSPGTPELDRMPYEPEQVFLHRWYPEGVPDDGVRLAQGEMFSVALDAYANARTRDSARSPGWIGAGAGNDFTSLRAGNRRMGPLTYRVLSSSGGKPSALMLRGPGVTKDFPEAIEGIRVGSKAKQLWFLHTTAFPDGPDRTIGSYVVRYSDGSTVTISLKYAENIMSWKDQRPTLAYQAAWKGEDARGEAIRLRTMPWDNPHPEKEIASIDFTSAEGSQAAPVLFAITGIR